MKLIRFMSNAEYQSRHTRRDHMSNTELAVICAGAFLFFLVAGMFVL